MKNTTAPIASETPERDAREACLPKKYPIDMMSNAHKNDAMKKRVMVSLVFVSASPATTGMNAFTEGMSFPKKIHHIPFLENVSWSAVCTLVKVASSSMRSFRARGFSYFFTRRKVRAFPSVLPSVPAITVGVSASVPFPTKYPHKT